MVSEAVFAVILAGGSGTRFWPKSRETSPKQLCKIGESDRTMLEITLDRLDGFIPPERRLIVTHAKQMALTKEIVKNKAEIFISEPEAKNTAAALTLAALEIQFQTGNPQAVMLSFHADHIIPNKEKFIASLDLACSVAKKGKLTLLGIKPSYPETGYGYIEKGEALDAEGAFSVAHFKEKPDRELANILYKSGNYLWNSGIFVWQIGTFLSEVREFLPHTYKSLHNLNLKEKASFAGMSQDSIGEAYRKLQSVAVDHAILESSQKTAVVTASFAWEDVGSWAALDKCFPTDEKGNLAYGSVMLLDTKGCTVDTDGPFVAALGLENIVIVAAKDAILVCPKERSQEVKTVVARLKDEKRLDLV